MKIIDLLYDFYAEMQEAEADNEQMSKSYLLKVQTDIVNDYAEKIEKEAQ